MRIQVGNWSLAVGIEWSMPRSDAEIKVAKREHAAGYFVLDTVLQETWLGFHEKTDGKTYAAGLLIGMVESNCVVRMAVNERESWVCSILNGKPIVGRDIIVSNNEADIFAREWSSVGQDTVLITDKAHSGKDIGGVMLALDEAIKQKQISSRELSCTLLKPTTISLSTPAIKYAVAGCAVASIGWLAHFQHWIGYAEAPKTPSTQMTQAAQAQLLERGLAEVDAQKKRAIVQLRADIAAAQDRYRTRSDPEQLWSQIASIRSQVPIAYLGYKPQALSCDIQACRLTWLGAGRFTLMSDKSRLPNVEQSLTPDFSATSNFPVGAPMVPLPTTDSLTKEKFEFWMASAIAARGASIRLEPMTPVMVTPAAQSQLKPVPAAYAGQWHAQFSSGQAVLEAGELIRFISHMPMRVTAIRNSQGTHAFELDGDYVFIPPTEN